MARLLARERGARQRASPPLLREAQILAWCDAHRRRAGDWPSAKSGPITDAPGETWSAVDDALCRGSRGLAGGSSLAKLLASKRGRRHQFLQPPLPIAQILKWADAHHRRTGTWPMHGSGSIHGVPGERWASVDGALRYGRRGLPGGWSLPRLLSIYRNRPYHEKGGPLTIKQIVAWARRHHRITGGWPRRSSGSVPGAPGENWAKIENALKEGLRGLPGKQTLLKLLQQHCGVPHRRYPPPLTTKHVLDWADRHRKRTGRWPQMNSGPVRGARHETWSRVDDALRVGTRGFPGGQSLAVFLSLHRGYRNKHTLPPLTLHQILKWADAHRRRTGDWPVAKSGAIPSSGGETWGSVNAAMSRARRGYRGPSTLADLLAQHRQAPYKRQGGMLNEMEILQWAKAHHARTGRWPHTLLKEPIPERPDETWKRVYHALNGGNRGLKRGTLAKLLARHFGVRDPLHPPRLTLKQILMWADGYYHRTGDWPSRSSGPIPEAPRENWRLVHEAMIRGSRGLSRGWTLVRLLSTHRKLLYSRKGLPLSHEMILQWAGEHHELTGRLPTAVDGAVHAAPGETWAAIDASLRSGKRNLRGGRSLDEFLYAHYVDAYADIGRPLTRDLIVEWMKRFRQRVGRWPTAKSAYVNASRTERWSAVDYALRRGTRGLPGGSSLAKVRKQLQSRSAAGDGRAATPPASAAAPGSRTPAPRGTPA